MSVVDVHLLSSKANPPQWLSGAILHGLSAAENAAQLRIDAPGQWLHAAELSAIVGASDLRFPTNSPTTIELEIHGLQEQLRQPNAHWWPLMEAIARNRQFIRVLLRPDVSELVGLRHLAQDFPRARFLIDPLRHGPNASVMGQIRLGELPNLWLTTLGAFPGSGPAWSHEKLSEVFHFVSGEVGASKLLFASGIMTEALKSGPNPENWLAGFQTLDEDQRRLILETNAREIFAA